MLPPELVSHVRLRYVGTSAQKARLVVNMIRGKQVENAITTLRLLKKVVAKEIGGALDSAVANARVKKPELDVDRLFVKTAFVDGGPSLKRIRPAPMGRAFRVQKRMCHVTIGLGETALPQVHAKPREGKSAEAASVAAQHQATGRKKTAAKAAPKGRPAASKTAGRSSGARGKSAPKK